MSTSHLPLFEILLGVRGAVTVNFAPLEHEYPADFIAWFQPLWAPVAERFLREPATEAALMFMRRECSQLLAEAVHRRDLYFTPLGQWSIV